MAILILSFVQFLNMLTISVINCWALKELLGLYFQYVLNWVPNRANNFMKMLLF